MDKLKVKRSERLAIRARNEVEVIKGVFKTCRTWQIQECMERMPIGSKTQGKRTVTVIAAEDGHRNVQTEDIRGTLVADLVYRDDFSVDITAVETRHFGAQGLRNYSSDTLVRNNSLPPKEILAELIQATQFMNDPETVLAQNPVAERQVVATPVPAFSQ